MRRSLPGASAGRAFLRVFAAGAAGTGLAPHDAQRRGLARSVILRAATRLAVRALGLPRRRTLGLRRPVRLPGRARRSHVDRPRRRPASAGPRPDGAPVPAPSAARPAPPGSGASTRPRAAPPAPVAGPHVADRSVASRCRRERPRARTVRGARPADPVPDRAGGRPAPALRSRSRCVRVDAAPGRRCVRSASDPRPRRARAGLAVPARPPRAGLPGRGRRRPAAGFRADDPPAAGLRAVGPARGLPRRRAERPASPRPGRARRSGAPLPRFWLSPLRGRRSVKVCLFVVRGAPAYRTQVGRGRPVPRRDEGAPVWMPLRTRNPGGDLLSQGAAPQVPSARAVFTSVFGMGTGVSPPQLPPETWISKSEFRQRTAVLQELHSEHEQQRSQALGRLVPVG